MHHAGGKTLFVFGSVVFKTAKEVVAYFEKEYGEIVDADISISTEEKVAIINYDISEDGLYECATFEGEEVGFREILARFEDSFEAVSIREAEVSKKTGNRVVKVDFVY
ncbi:MAG: hypothetical protein H6767_02655 [Candidatus Peribacteria bacterium]|nr:MAG: hypothetical protein H6767_02655 [Candidatus Peribacteria bacterium]